eukprot:2274589-Rhodomonas_salina.1
MSLSVVPMVIMFSNHSRLRMGGEWTSIWARNSSNWATPCGVSSSGSAYLLSSAMIRMAQLMRTKTVTWIEPLPATFVSVIFPHLPHFEQMWGYLGWARLPRGIA